MWFTDSPVINCIPAKAFVNETNVRLTCHVRAEPSPTSSFWIVDDNRTTVSSSGEVLNNFFTYPSVSRFRLLSSLCRVLTTGFKTTKYQRSLIVIIFNSENKKLKRQTRKILGRLIVPLQAPCSTRVTSSWKRVTFDAFLTFIRWFSEAKHRSSSFHCFNHVNKKFYI